MTEAPVGADDGMTFTSFPTKPNPAVVLDISTTHSRFVNLTVAIVINLIASLFSNRTCDSAGHFTTNAGALAIGTASGKTCVARTECQCLIDCTVAIIVLAVAKFGLSLRLWFTAQSSVLTHCSAWPTPPHHTFILAHQAVGNVFIDAIVTIIISTVADFIARWRDFTKYNAICAVRDPHAARTRHVSCQETGIGGGKGILVNTAVAIIIYTVTALIYHAGLRLTHLDIVDTNDSSGASRGRCRRA